MTTVLITGSEGFVGRNLRAALAPRSDLRLLLYDIGNDPADLERFLGEADVIVHLAGVNRPKDPAAFTTGNVGLTETMVETLRQLGRAPKIVFSSSIQAALDNPYGRSKRQAEDLLQRYAEDTGAEVVVYRFPNLFGKWSRPHYNSVVATFCSQIARDEPITISDPAHPLELAYIADVVEALVGEIDEQGEAGFRFGQVPPIGAITLGELANLIRSFRSLRSEAVLPPLDRFKRALYATYLSYLPTDAFAYELPPRADQRGVLAEFIKSEPFGQIFVSRTKPGITRGDHYHHTKTEKFLVLEGQAVIRFRHILDENVLSYHVAGTDLKVLDIPPGYTHNITNVGDSELVVLFWASEIFDPEQPDTYYEAV